MGNSVEFELEGVLKINLPLAHNDIQIEAISMLKKSLPSYLRGSLCAAAETYRNRWLRTSEHYVSYHELPD